MASVRVPAPAAAPTNAAPLPRLFASVHALGLEAHLSRAKRGVSSLALALVWLTLAWRGTSRPEWLAQMEDPLLAALLDRPRPPAPATLRRSLSGVRVLDAEHAEAATAAQVGASEWQAEACHSAVFHFMLRWWVTESAAIDAIWNGGNWRELVAEYADEQLDLADKLTGEAACPPRPSTV